MKSIQYFRQPLAFFLLLLMITTTLSCYTRRQMPKARLNKVSIESLDFIVIDAAAPYTNMWVLSKVAVQDSALTAHFSRASPEYVQRIGSIRTNGDRGANQNKVLVFVNAPTAKSYADEFDARLDLSDINRIEVFEPDAAKVVGLVFGSLAALAGVVLIILVIACACPYVYVDTPTGPMLEGELYAGAAYPQLERHDWLPMPNLQAQDQQYRITLANKLFENQHTNQLELLALDAPPGIRPLFDKYGRLYTIAAPKAPTSATNVSGQNVLDHLLNEDKKIFRGDLNNQRPDATEQLHLRFAKPEGAQQAKLLIRAKNNSWLDYTYHEFQNELGVYGPKIRQKYLKKSAAENLAWMESQKMPLAVWLETQPGHWEKVDYFNVVGPMAFKNDVLPIDLSQVQGNSVNLRLEFGFNFWEIDYAALDFSLEAPVRQHQISPLSAITEAGIDVAPALAQDDGDYYDQPNIGDEARISFAAPPLPPGHSRSLILHAKGHYEIKYLPAGGRPAYFKLKAWEKENALPRLSRERWLEAKKLTATPEK